MKELIEFVGMLLAVCLGAVLAVVPFALLALIAGAWVAIAGVGFQWVARLLGVL